MPVMIKSCVSVVVLLLTAQLALADSEPVVDGSVPVTFAADAGRRVDISLREGVAIGGSGGAVFFQTLCTTPCTTRLRSGRHYLVFADPDENIVGEGPFLFDGPTTIAMRARSRRGARLGLIIGGALLASGGVATMALTEEDHIFAGSMLLGGGIALVLATLALPDTFTMTQTSGEPRLSRSGR
ncbi:MAG: hypothetical protein H0T46_29245 [Deltaproteobacteria bacterium]|nr:hypothetical protein [Deltaproteobacteria bacterium]